MTSLADRIALVVGTGFGSGWLRPAPGTWGSLVGFAYFFGLLKLPLPVAVAVALGVIALSVWCSGRCARILGKEDPGEVVIDEIAAVPIAAWPIALLDAPAWWVWAAVFAAWRAADIIKPPPARQLEALPGGWGIVADDLMSAAYVGAAFWLLTRLA
ncbi:MAG: phosphatidylglycerophosphatase A [Chthoniobacteraceae bacterium]